MVEVHTGGAAAFIPLTEAERRHVGGLLANVSTHTLLLSLDRLHHGHEDARLVIAALLDRFPD